MNSRQFACTSATAALLVLSFAPSAGAKTFSFPHVLETSGKITMAQLGQVAFVPVGIDLVKGAVPKTPVAIDTEIHVTYIGGLPGALPPSGGGLAEATLDLYLYDQTGAVMKNSNVDVCNPCTATLSATKRKESYRLDDFITKTRTVPFDQPVKVGFAIAVINGDVGNVNLTSSITAVVGKKGEAISVFSSEPKEITAPAP